MPFPKTADELLKSGYKFKNSGVCSGCGAAIHWYITPKGKLIPLDSATLEPHFATCPKADQFRK